MSDRVEFTDRGLALAGELTLETVPSLSMQLHKRLSAPSDAGDTATVDLSRVTRADSAGLVLLIGIKRDVTQAGRKTDFVAAPEQLVALAQANKLDTILGLS